MAKSAALADPAILSQAVFRTVMEAMARPGEVRLLATTIIPPRPLKPATAAIARTLFDYETPVWLDPRLAASPDVAAWLRFETGAPLTTDPRLASFALIADPLALPSFDTFSLGTSEYPDRATTLVIEIDRFSGGEAMRLSGPGLARPRDFSAAPLPPDFADLLIANRQSFPRGVDIILVGDDAVAALPRSVHVERRSY